MSEFGDALTDFCIICEDPLSQTEAMSGALWHADCIAQQTAVPAKELKPMDNSLPDARANVRRFNKTVERKFGQRGLWGDE